MQRWEGLVDEYVGGLVNTPIMAPFANGYAESSIGRLKRECLNHFLCFSLAYLDHITSV
jgi:putative transposase